MQFHVKIIGDKMADKQINKVHRNEVHKNDEYMYDMKNHESDKSSYMRIGEFADFFDISQKALRIYEKMEILRPAYIDEETGYRYYHADQIKQMNAVVELKALGFSLKEIKSILQGGTDSEQFKILLQKRYNAWQDEKLIAERKMYAISSIQERFNSARDMKKIEEMTDEERAWLLVKMVCVEDVRTQHVISEAIWL